MEKVDGYTLIDLIKKSIESLMNMKLDEAIDIENNYFDIEGPDIEIELPEDAKLALKDATTKAVMI